MKTYEEVREKVLQNIKSEKKYQFNFSHTNLPELLPNEKRFYDTKVTRIVEGLTKEKIHLGL